MESEKVRIIDKKGGVRFVMPHIAKDKKLMSNYGFIVQDLKVNQNSQPILSEVVNTETNEPLDLLEEPIKVKGKPGRKPTIK